MIAADPVSQYYSKFLRATYDCVDRVVFNARFLFGCSGGGFRAWWEQLHGTLDTLDNTHLIRMVARFSRRIYGWAKKHKVPVIHCVGKDRPGQRVAEECPLPTTPTPGVFAIVVKKAPFPIWHVKRYPNKGLHIYRTERPSWVNHYAFHIWDRDWGHLSIKMCGHPPFSCQIAVNGHEYVAIQAQKKGLEFRKEDNCFTECADAAALSLVADTLRSPDAIGRLQQACAYWLDKVCLCLALSKAEQEKSGFRYQYFTYQAEYSRNLLFEDGRVLDKMFQGLIDRTRAALDIRTIKTVFGRNARGGGQGTEPGWEIVFERPSYDMTILKAHCGPLKLKLYSKGERVLRIEATVDNARTWKMRLALANFPAVVERLQGMLEKFLQALHCADAACVDDQTWEDMPVPSQVGKSRVAGVNLYKPRLRAVLQAVLALSVLPARWGGQAVAAKVREFLGWSEDQYSARQASYDLKKLRGKKLIAKDGGRYYAASAEGLKTVAALAIVQDKILKPVLAKVIHDTSTPPTGGPLEAHYEAVQKEMRKLFEAAGLAA
jgi:hypothetical protein